MLVFWVLGLTVAASVAVTLRRRLLRAQQLAIEAAQVNTELSALLDYKEWLNKIVDNVPALIGYVDAEQRFQFNNLEFEHWLGKPKGEITGRPVREVFGEEEYQKVKPHLERALRGAHVTFHLELRLRGETRHAQTWDADLQSGKVYLSEPWAAMLGAMARSQRTGAPLALMHLDIDRFKPIANGLGSEAGEALLKEVGARLRGCVRATDTVARIGADQFVVLLEQLKERGDAFRVAEKMLHAVREPVSAGGREVRLTTSIGVAFPDEAGLPPEELVKRAGAALSDAKAAGRDAYRISG
jgi:diguanylate cyclase (GGDEF)-like protein/PAS domain S-box-containing protein